MRLKLRVQYQEKKEERVLISWDANQLVHQLISYLQTQFQVQNLVIEVDGFRLISCESVGSLVDEHQILDVIEVSTPQQKHIKVDEQKSTQLKIVTKSAVPPREVSSSSSSDQIVPIQAPRVRQVQPVQKTTLKTNGISNASTTLPRTVVTKQIQKKAQHKPPRASSTSSEESIEPIPNKKVALPPKQHNNTIVKPQIKQTQIVQKQVPVDSDSSSSPIVVKANPFNKLKLNIKSPEEEIRSKQKDWKLAFTQAKALQAPKIQRVQSLIELEDYKKLTVQQLEQDPTIIQPMDVIQFKYVFLDTDKCEPSLSQLLKGKVLSNDVDAKQLKISSNEELSLYYNELADLEIDISKMPKLRQDRIKQLTIHIVEKPIQVQNLINFTQAQSEQPKVDPFGIGRQVNYYYSDKNYPKDDFIQQHSAKDPEHFMLFGLLMNFPRIKKVLRSEEELKQVVDSYVMNNPQPSINFELKQNEDNQWIIRKKPKQQNQQ